MTLVAEHELQICASPRRSRKSRKAQAPFLIHPRGFWESTGGHFFDARLCAELTSLFLERAATSVVDLGCGDGSYVLALRGAGLNVDGFDGNPTCSDVTEGVCQNLDLSEEHVFDHPYEWVLSLEVGEHIPAEFEKAFISNLHRNNISGIVVSWAVPGQGGRGHVNERSNSYVRSIFSDLGYLYDAPASDRLRAASSLKWFRNTIMVFVRQQRRITTLLT
jgi:SAM-dependent methyltransferase